MVALAIPAAIIFTILLMIIIRFTACFSIYFIITAIILGLFFSTYYFIDLGLKVSPDIKILSKIPDHILYKAIAGLIPAHILYKAIAGLSLLIGVIILISICCFRSRINIAINMIKAAARFVNQHWYLFFISIVKFAIWVGFIALCLV